MKLHLDVAVGETGDLNRQDNDKDQSESLAQRIKDLNARLQDIRREQVFQRVRKLLECVFVCKPGQG